MKLSRNSVRAIIALLVVALGGLVYLQYTLLMNSIELKEQTFRRNVVAAMNFAIDKLEEIDARNAIFISQDSTSRSARGRSRSDSLSTISLVSVTNGSNRVQAGKDVFQYRLDRPQRVVVRAFSVLGSADTTIVDSVRGTGVHAIHLPSNRFKGGAYFVQIKTDSGISTTRLESGKRSFSFTVDDNDIRRGKVVKKIADSFSELPYVPMSRRFSQSIIDSVIAFSLTHHGIPLVYDFGMFSGDSLSVSRSSVPKETLAQSEFQMPIIPLEPAPISEMLALHFPGYRAYLVSSFFPELGSSVLLLGIIVFCFAFTIRVIVRQREFASRLTDFINNMTHEFKTPISTIALASEALAQPEVKASRTKLNRYTAVIADENRRMRGQVDKILQMAALEEGETEFNKLPTDIHRTIRQAVANIELQVTARHGTIVTSLEAKESIVNVDAVHIENVIHNLLENAVKYSDTPPAISLTTASEQDAFVLRVQDGGIGIPKEHLEKVFDKYYRVPTGNIHDVKGFGLGLSYVKLIAEAHGGTVSIRRNPGKGTTVELRFPLLHSGGSGKETKVATRQNPEGGA